jgi:hypothetical protein
LTLEEIGGIVVDVKFVVKEVLVLGVEESGWACVNGTSVFKLLRVDGKDITQE